MTELKKVDATVAHSAAPRADWTVADLVER